MNSLAVFTGIDLSGGADRTAFTIVLAGHEAVNVPPALADELAAALSGIEDMRGQKLMLAGYALGVAHGSGVKA
jgi:hypothetical protein